jgi:hypothetical protein
VKPRSSSLRYSPYALALQPITHTSTPFSPSSPFHTSNKQALVLFIPITRGLARLICAPCALCLISCVETVGVDVEVGDVAAMGDGMEFAGEGGGAGGGFGAGGAGSGKGGLAGASSKQKKDAAAATALIVACGPCVLCLSPFYYILCKPMGKCLSVACTPIGNIFTGMMEGYARSHARTHAHRRPFRACMCVHSTMPFTLSL